MSVSLAQLARDRGYIGNVLRSLPPELIREADRYGAWKFELAEKAEDPNRLPLPDPWQFLLDAPCISAETKKVFRAAQSQIIGIQRLCRMALGVASLRTDWHKSAAKAKATKDKKAHLHAMGQVASALMRYEPLQSDLETQSKLDEEFNRQFYYKRAEVRKNRAKRGRAREIAEPVPVPKWSDVRRQFPLETTMVDWWIQLATSGPPGFMFWRNEALTEFLFALRKRNREKPHRNLGLDFIKNKRQTLGLIPVEKHRHLVWDVKLESQQDGKWIITGWSRQLKKRREQLFQGRLQEFIWA
jgi:hypothetical protein